MAKFIVDNEIELRVLRGPDAVPFFDLIDRNREFLKTWIPWLNETQTLEQTQHFIEQGLMQYYSNKSFQAGIWYLGELVGSAGFHPIDWRHHRTSLGYWLGEEYQGKGIVIRSVEALIAHSFQELKLNRVEIRCATDNLKSQAIPKKLGFSQEGIIRSAEWLYDHYVDHIVFGILKKEWELQKA